MVIFIEKPYMLKFNDFYRFMERLLCIFYTSYLQILIPLQGDDRLHVWRDEDARVEGLWNRLAFLLGLFPAAVLFKLHVSSREQSALSLSFLLWSFMPYGVWDASTDSNSEI